MSHLEITRGTQVCIKQEALQSTKKSKPLRAEHIHGKTVAFSLFMWVIVLLFLIPFYVLVVYAFKTREATMLNNPLSFPASLYLDNFSVAIDKAKLNVAFLNSLQATVLGTILLVVVCSMVAY
ncbi:MAG: hypothetical protein RSC68_18940, partial [Acinetobacter sp.]